MFVIFLAAIGSMWWYQINQERRHQKMNANEYHRSLISRKYQVQDVMKSMTGRPKDTSSSWNF